MTGRRWSDWTGAGALDRARRVALALWPFVASMAAAAVLLCAAIVSIGAVRDRDRFAEVARNVAATARSAAMASEQATAASAGNTRLLEEIAPCDPGDPPESPGCVRQARTDTFVRDFLGRISSDLARGLAAHDANVHRSLEALRRRIAAESSPLPTPGPITATVVPSSAAPTTTAPATTTTSCPRLPNGKCRP